MSETRFAFGDNWQSFLQTLDEDRIEEACRSLHHLLRLPDPAVALTDARFLDLGSGSGLFSLAAYRSGASIVSIDYDPQSVACTEQLRQREQAKEDRWQIRQGSALDEALMLELGKFDFVYSWGVLHHTGDMTRAIQLAAERVADGGLFAIAIYNDQGGGSRRWLRIKQTYHRLPGPLKKLWVGVIAFWYESKFAVARLLRGKNPLPFREWREKKQDRGMSAWHDWVDWVGGLPFEVAKPEQIIVPLVDRGFSLINLTTVGSGWGCNQFVFRRTRSDTRNTNPNS